MSSQESFYIKRSFSFYNIIVWKSVVGARDFPNNPKMGFYVGVVAIGEDSFKVEDV